MPERIQRKRTRGWRMPEGAVYVGRPTRWGNPFATGHGPGAWWVDAPDGERWFETHAQARRAAVDEYYYALTNGTLDDPWLIRDTHLIAGRDLACWCPLDQPCHADVLLEIANRGDA